MADVSVISVLLRAKDETAAAFSKVEANAGKMASGIAKHRRSIGLGMTAMGGAIVGIGALSIKAASDVEEMRGKFNTVFGSMSGEVEKWAGTHGDAVGRSRFKLMEYASTLQDTFVPMGFAREEASKFARSVTELAVDIGSFNNQPTEEVVKSLQSALVGNTETVRKYGIVITAAAVEQRILNEGTAKNKGEITEAMKVQARMNMIMEGSTDAIGDAERTSDSFANQMVRLKSAVFDAQVGVGEQLLPVLTSLVEKLTPIVTGIMDWMKAHPDLTKVIVIATAAVGAIMLVLGPLLLILPGIVTAVGLLSVAFGTLSVAMGPITLAIIGIAAVITAAVIVWKKWDDMSTKVKIAVVALGIAIGPVTAAIVVGIAVWKNWDKIVDVVKKAIASFTKTVIGFIIKLGEGFLAITKWIPGMGDARRAIEGTMDSLRDAQHTMTVWADESDRSLVMTSEAWSGLEEQQYRSSDKIQEAIRNMGNKTEDLTTTTQRELSAQTSSYETEIGKQTVIVKTFAETRVEIAKLNLEAERTIRDTNKEEFLKGLEESRAAREQRAAHEKQIAEQISDSWTTFKNDQDATFKALKDANLDFADVVEELAIKHGVSVTQMADDLAMAGVSHNDTSSLLASRFGQDVDNVLIDAARMSNGVIAEQQRMASERARIQGASLSELERMIEQSNAKILDDIEKARLEEHGLKEVQGALGMGAHIGEGVLETIRGRADKAEGIIPAEHADPTYNTGIPLESIQRAQSMIEFHTKSALPMSRQSESDLREDMLSSLVKQVSGDTKRAMEAMVVGDIPLVAFAGGGIVTKPTLGLVGEAGPEAIVPLGRGGGMGTVNNFHFHGAVYGVEDLKEAVVEAVRDHAISGGFSGVFAEA
tara:strand:+ start:75 stop:2702 length:2628 start_codon:yes stop_codon:yes gene_type:complete